MGIGYDNKRRDIRERESGGGSKEMYLQASPHAYTNQNEDRSKAEDRTRGWLPVYQMTGSLLKSSLSCGEGYYLSPDLVRHFPVDSR